MEYAAKSQEPKVILIIQIVEANQVAAKNGNNGFTFVEIMIVIVIIGILASIAYPLYNQYVIRTKRTDVMSEMLQIAQRLQTYKSINGTFNNANLGTIYGSALDADNSIVLPKQGNGLYKLYFVNSNENVLSNSTGNGWILKAVPLPTQSQVGDGVICLNNQGEKSWAKGINTCNSLSANSTWSSR